MRKVYTTVPVYEARECTGSDGVFPALRCRVYTTTKDYASWVGTVFFKRGLLNKSNHPWSRNRQFRGDCCTRNSKWLSLIFNDMFALLLEEQEIPSEHLQLTVSKLPGTLFNCWCYFRYSLIGKKISLASFMQVNLKATCRLLVSGQQRPCIHIGLRECLEASSTGQSQRNIWYSYGLIP